MFAVEPRKIMQKQTKEKNTDKKIFAEREYIKYYCVLCLLFIISVILFLLLWGEKNSDKYTKVNAFSGVDRICELATLRCFYHDVAEYEKQPDGLFQYGLFQYGYKKMWMEYDGIVEIGIDADEVEVYNPDKDGVVKIYVPQARVLNVYADKDTMSAPLVDTGMFTTISIEEKAAAFANAQETMKANAESDSSLLRQGYNNAKKLLEQYVLNVGKQIGEEYKVEWLSHSVSNDNQ